MLIKILNMGDLGMRLETFWIVITFLSICSVFVENKLTQQHFAYANKTSYSSSLGALEYDTY